jgi:hypothetical protein
MTRLEHIRNETTKLRIHLQTLHKEVSTLETQRRQSTADGAEWAKQVSQLREDNRALRIECHCLSMEVDLYASGGMPLGVTDETFFNNVPPGPYGPPAPRPPFPTANRPAPRLPAAAGAAIANTQLPYPVQPIRPSQPPTYEESVYFPPPPLRFGTGNSAATDILRQVPPAPRPVWLSPTIQQSPMPSMASLLPHNHPTTPPQLPPRPNSASPRTPNMSMQSNPMVGAVAAVPPLLPGAGDGPRNNSDEGQGWVCQKCTVENHPALNYCEVCEMPRHL